VSRTKTQCTLLTSCALVALLVVSCNSDEPKQTTLRFWHFWSEPTQQRVLDSLIKAYEHSHPDVRIESTPLSWSDGKAKLQLAFNAGTQPDVIHLGLDWFAEFHSGGVFRDLPDTITSRSNVISRSDSAMRSQAAIWCVNARAHVISTKSNSRYQWVLCSSDAHNVIKRVLPMLWKLGARSFYRDTGEGSHAIISANMDSTLVNALWLLRGVAVGGALIERSRQIDESLLRGDVSNAYTGSWIIDMAHDRNIDFLDVMVEESILNGDVLAVGANTQNNTVATDFVAYLTHFNQARAFCAAVSDAGYPADLAQASADSVFTSSRLRRGFLETALISRPLPLHAKLLSIEPIVEDMIVKSYTAPSKEEIIQIVRSAKSAIVEIEASGGSR